MKFNGITKKGREYLAKIQAENKPINFAKIKIGDGRLDNYDNPAELEHLINQKVEKGILTLNQEHDTVILTTNIDNVSLRTGYYPREIGVFVNDNGQEIMYYYMNDGDETSWIPPETDGPFKIELKLNLIASNAQSIVVEGVGKDLYITKEFLETNYTQKGGYTGTAQEIDDRVVSALGKEDGKFPLTEAIKGNVYYFPGNKKFYICKEAQNRRVSVPDGNFEELSIWENRKRLENLDRNFLYKIDKWAPKDEDELVKTGIFQIKGTTSKLKRGFCGSQCFVLVFNTSTETDDWITQVAFSYYNNFSIAIRTRNGETKQWTAWRYLSAN